MSQRCINCQLTRYKLNELMNQYEELIKTKQQQIYCSRRIISELEHELSQCKKSLLASGLFAKELQRNTHKILSEQQESIQYLKQRQVKLVQQLKNTQNQIFKLVIDVQDTLDSNKLKSARQKDNSKQGQNSNQHKEFITPKKIGVGPSSTHVTLDKSRQNKVIDKFFQQSGTRHSASDQKQSLKLKVTEDKLQLMNIKYKMALLKTVEIATLR